MGVHVALTLCGRTFTTEGMMSQLMFQHTRVQHFDHNYMYNQSRSHDNQSPLYISPILLFFCQLTLITWLSTFVSKWLCHGLPLLAHCTSQNPTHKHTLHLVLTALHRTRLNPQPLLVHCTSQNPTLPFPLLLTNFGNSCSFLNSKECS